MTEQPVYIMFSQPSLIFNENPLLMANVSTNSLCVCHQISRIYLLYNLAVNLCQLSLLFIEIDMSIHH